MNANHIVHVLNRHIFIMKKIFKEEFLIKNSAFKNISLTYWLF
jgi:hypothetical protein